MLHFLRNLLRNKNFWWTMLGTNIVGAAIGGQPLVLCVTVPFLAGMYLLLGLGNFVTSRSFPKVMKWTGILIAWFITAFFVSVVFAGVGASIMESNATLAGVLVVNLFLWVIPVVLVRRWRRRREVREYREMQQQSERTQRQQASAQKQRSDARARCELFYNLHGPEIRERFSHSQFQDYWKRHFGDENPPEYVEERAAQLLSIMQQHLEKAGHREQKKSLADIAAWFLEEKTKIDELPLNPEDKEQMIADLEGRFTQLQQKHIRSMNP